MGLGFKADTGSLQSAVSHYVFAVFSYSSAAILSEEGNVKRFF